MYNCNYIKTWLASKKILTQVVLFHRNFKSTQNKNVMIYLVTSPSMWIDSQFWWGVFLEIYFSVHRYFRSKWSNVFVRFTLFAMQIKFQKFQRILIFLNFEARPTWWSKWSWFCENTLVCVMMATLDKWTPWLALGQVVCISNWWEMKLPVLCESRTQF